MNMTPPRSQTAAIPEPGPAATPAPGPIHAAPSGPPSVATPPPRRRRLLAAAGIAAAVAAVALGVRWYTTRFDESTDDAQVDADVTPVAARVPGAVALVLVHENQAVKKGDLLVVIDHADYAARARQAEAELETARGRAAAAEAQVAAAAAGARRAQLEAAKAEEDLRRAEQLRQGDAIPPERLDAARATGGMTRAGVASSRAQGAAAAAQVALAHAQVKAAEAARDLAALQLSYTKVWATQDGVISKLSVRQGQLVASGQPMAELVPSQTYVVANFKETQVGRMRPGEKATVEIDAYPGLKLQGRVESLSGGTGARFSLIPPDNASGNFVKVVERVPVRIAWVRPPPPEVMLRAGLSVYVTVQTR